MVILQKKFHRLVIFILIVRITMVPIISKSNVSRTGAVIIMKTGVPHGTIVRSGVFTRSPGTTTLLFRILPIQCTSYRRKNLNVRNNLEGLLRKEPFFI